jgi:Tfp pilus assembly protein PilX
MIRNQRGSALLLVIIVFAMLFILLGISLERSGRLFVRIHKKHLETAALNLAEAGVDYTIHRLVYSKENYSGEEQISLDTGTFSTSVTRLTTVDKIEILSTGKATGSDQLGNVTKTLRVVVQRSQENTERPLIILSWEEVS